MWFRSVLTSWKSRLSHSRCLQQPGLRHRGSRLTVEPLEDRPLPSNFSAASVSDLIADITEANATGGANTITLTASTASPYVLTVSNNNTNGATGLPVIGAKDNLTIVGNGDTIERSTATGTPDFRLLDVASGASLTLENLTLQGGTTIAINGKNGMDGGGIYNLGTLVLNGVTVQNIVAGFSGINSALGGITAWGGGIYSFGSLTLEGGTIFQSNEALATSNGDGSAYGGGVCAVMGGTVTMTNCTLDNNTAAAGDEAAYGGGLCAKATVTMTNCTLDGNVAQMKSSSAGSYGGGLYLLTYGNSSLIDCTFLNNSTLANVGVSLGGGLYVGAASGYNLDMINCTVQSNSALNSTGYAAEGGGLYIAGGTVYLDAATVAKVTGNTASSGAAYDNIVGTYTLT
jgi:hypothetical protein